MVNLYKRMGVYINYIVPIIILVFVQVMAELYLPTLMSDIVDIGILKNDINYIFRVGLYMVFIALIGTVAAILASYYASKTSSSFGRDLRQEVFSRVQSFSLKEFDNLGTSSLITRTTNDVSQVQALSLTMLRVFVRAPIMGIGGIVLALYKEPRLSLTLIVVIALMIILIVSLSRRSIKLYKAIQIKIDKLNLVVRERLTGVRVIRAFNRKDEQLLRFEAANEDLVQASIDVNRLMAMLMPIMMLLFNLTTVAIIWFGGFRIEASAMEIGDLMAFIQYAMQIMFSVVMMTMVFMMIPRASASASRINEVLELESDIKDPSNPVTPDAFNKEDSLIKFSNVSFKYLGAEECALKNINFDIKRGELVAIIGGTGSGKSTLINMLPRFYDPTSGDIYIDGLKLQEYSRDKLRSKIGFVPQKSVLFSGSIEDNLRYGKKDATDEEMREALDMSQASEFVDKLDDGIKSVLSQGGTNLSGGQKQRLSIARAFIRKSDLYIFDDSFSALDYKTSSNLKSSIKNNFKDATTIIVAQRITSIMDCDKIIVMEEGKIDSVGTHSELLENSIVYKEIVISQLSKEEI
ncbi:MAG: ABC transporter ATP-binding protein [Acidaminobacteraceae bacterium]